MRSALLISAASLAAPFALAQTAPLAPVEQTPLAKDAFAMGLLDRDEGALPADLWRGADAPSLMLLLEAAPSRPAGPSLGDALRRVLLSAGDAPADATPALGGAKLKALVRAGFIDEAREIESLASGTKNDPASAEAMASADLLSNDMAAACEKGRRADTGRDKPFWVRLRVVCYAIANELDAAELALGILRENGGLDDIDEALLAPLAAGGKPKAPVAPVDAVHFGALKAMSVPVSAALLDRAEAGVVKAAAKDAGQDWPTRLEAGKRAAAMGVFSAGELRALFDAAPATAAPAYRDIRAMSAPELLRDKAGRVAAEIAAAPDFESLFAASALYADDLRALEGAIVPASEASAFALARLASGDAIGAERWLIAAAPAMQSAAPEGEAMRFIDLVGVLNALEPAAAARIAAAANIVVAPPRIETEETASPPDGLAPIIGAAIEAAAEGGKGEAALAALAASDAASRGDPVAEVIVKQSLVVAGLGDIVRRREVERALSAIYPSATAPAPAIAPAAASAPDAMTPRLKPKRAT
ncbi:MAG: hypothetical protein ACOZAA_18020 [Pseudomonadota bacterium]